MSHKVKALLVCSGLALALGACGGKKAPTGQVVATLNGQEVTLQEVNAELAAGGLPGNIDRQEAQRIALQRVIERKLLVGDAQKQELDKTPEYMAQKSRADEMLLAQQLIRKQAGNVAQPTQADIDAFMRENPNIFANRQQLVVDQIRFRPPSDTSVLKSLEAIHTQDGVAQTLTTQKIQFQRGRGAIDTARLPEAVVKRIDALPEGEPFVLPAQGYLTINTIVGRAEMPIPAEQAKQIATEGWREKQFNTIIKGRMDTLKKEAKITYQQGFAPPAAKPAAPTAPVAPAAKPATPGTPAAPAT